MKILITVGIYPPDIGGPASFVPKIANKLVENGFEVVVVCLTNKKEIDNENYLVKRILRKQNLIIRWIKTVLVIVINGRKSDVIFVNGLPMESYIANLILRKKLIRKIVGDWAWERGRNKGITEDSFEDFQNNKHNLHLEIAKFSRGWTATKADIVITPSYHLKKVVNGWGVDLDKISVIYNGTEIKNINRNKINDKIRILTVGRLAPWKNIDKIIDSIKLLMLENINLEFYIVCIGPKENYLKDLAVKNDLKNNIIFTGQKNKQELEEIYKNSDIYIQASGYEGLPHVILEAINFNMTIISTPIGGTNEILLDGKNGWLVELKNNKSPDAFELKQMIVNVLENRKIDNEKKLNAKKYIIDNFDQEKNLNKYIQLIKS